MRKDNNGSTEYESFVEEKVEKPSILKLAELIQYLACETISAHDKATAVREACEDDILSYDEGLDLIIEFTK